MACMEQRKADGAILRLVEKYERVKEEALKYSLEAERNLVAKQILELKVAELNGIGNNDDAVVLDEIKAIYAKGEELMVAVDNLEPVLRDVKAKILEFKRDLDDVLMMVEAVGKLEVIRHVGGNDEAAVQNNLKELVDKLKRLRVESKL